MNKRNDIGIYAVVGVGFLVILLIAMAFALNLSSTGPTAAATPTPAPTATPQSFVPFLDRDGLDRWGLPGWLFTSFRTTSTNANDTLYFVPILLAADQTWTSVAVRVDGSAVNGVVRICVYDIANPISDPGGLLPGDLIADFGTTTATTTGTKTINGPWNVTQGYKFVAVASDGDTVPTFRTFEFANGFIAPVTGSLTSPSGSPNNIALESDVSSTYIDTGCPADASSIIAGTTPIAQWPFVWVLNNE